MSIFNRSSPMEAFYNTLERPTKGRIGPAAWFIVGIIVFLVVLTVVGAWMLTSGIVILLLTFFIPMRISSKMLFFLFGIGLILIWMFLP